MKMNYEVYTNNFLIESEFKYYFLGLICSDGYISADSNGVTLVLKESDFNFLDSIRKQLTSKNLRYKVDTKSYTLYFASKIIKDELLKYINDRQKTLNLIYPPNIPNKYQKDFIRGYFDGDGNLNVKMSYRKLKTGEDKSYPGLRLRILGTYPFLLGLAQTLKNENVINFVRNPSRKGKENVFYIEYAFRSAESIMNWLYSNSKWYLKRKKDVFEFITKSDKNQLINNYNNNGFYNTLASSNNLQLDEGIVGPLLKNSD